MNTLYLLLAVWAGLLLLLVGSISYILRSTPKPDREKQY